MANQQGNRRGPDDEDEDYRDRMYREHRYESGNYLGQGGQQMGNPYGNDYGRYPQYGGGYAYSQYPGGYGMGNRGHYFGGNPGYHDPGHPGGMGLGQHGNFRHQAYSHLGERNFGHLGPEYGAHMSYRGDYGYTGEPPHESFGQRVKHWLQGHRGKGPQGYQRSDERIREHVCEVLSDDDRVDATFIEVAVKNGEVTLSGTVQDRDTKRLAEQSIEDISGIKDIQNQIRVVPRDQQLTPTGSGPDRRHRA